MDQMSRQKAIEKSERPDLNREDTTTVEGLIARKKELDSFWTNIGAVHADFDRQQEQRRRLQRFGAAVERVLEQKRIYEAALYRAHVLADDIKLFALSQAREQKANPPKITSGITLYDLESTTQGSLRSLDGLVVERPQTPGITAMEAASRYGYSRAGARECLERGVSRGLLQKSQDLRNGKWVVVYSPTEEAGHLFTTPALPA